MQQKKGLESEMLGWILFGLLVLAIIMLAIFILKDKGISYIDYLKQLFRFK